jgi:hypothetical protein
MLNSYVKIISLSLFFCLSTYAYSQKIAIRTSLETLEDGVYQHKKATKKSYKTFYNEDAEQKLWKILMMNDELKETLGVFESTDSVGNKVLMRENEAFEYCPKLGYIIYTGGHGYILVYDLKNKKELCSNPSTYAYSPSKKYRFGSLQDDGVKYFLEEKVEGEYICYNIYFPNQIYGIYWADDETLYFLCEETNDDGSKHQVAYSAKFLKKQT